MTYRLRDDLSYCVIGNHAVFLDVEADRYFTLPEPMERAFLAHIASPRQAIASELIECELIVDSGASAAMATRVETPSRSAQEAPEAGARIGVRILAEVMLTLRSCRRQLRGMPLKNVLHEAAQYRDSRCLSGTGAAARSAEQHLLQCASAFESARRYLPVAMCCLPDSLALLRFLARRGIPGNIVFGITYDPFSAHCWVQFRDIAINETVGAAMAHTVILVV